MSNIDTSSILSFIRTQFNQPGDAFIGLHEPRFVGNEKKYVADAIDSTFVSSVGAYVNRFEEMMTQITGARYAVATVNGTTALHLALILAGVKAGDAVITQPLTFVATANAITHAGAEPIFVDVDRDTMGLSPEALTQFLNQETTVRDGACYHKSSGKRIAAVVPMHTFGFPMRIAEVAAVAKQFHIPLVEDAAESLGSYVGAQHTGTFGMVGAFSFNGNKTVTCGGGGAVVTNDEGLAKLGKHISTTAKVPHAWEFVHDQVGYNYRMPNLNAAMACAQLEMLDAFIKDKRDLAEQYAQFFKNTPIEFVWEQPGTTANYWLNTILFENFEEREAFLKESNAHKVMTRPIWTLMNKLPMYAHCAHGDLSQSQWLEERAVNIPSSVRLHTLKNWL